MKRTLADTDVIPTLDGGAPVGPNSLGLYSIGVVVDCIVSDDAPLNAAVVDELVKSIGTVGLLNPLTIQRHGLVPHLVAGRHRLAAVKRLGWKEVQCLELQNTDEGGPRPKLVAELALIDENIVRRELSPTDRGMLAARRKELYEALHPQTKAGLSQVVGMNKACGRGRKVCDDVKADRFTRETAKLTGRSERSVQKDVERGTVLKNELPALKDTILDKGTELDALVKLKKIEPEKVAEVVKAAKTRKPIRATAVLSEAQKRRIERLGDRIYRRIEGTALDTPDEIAALIHLNKLEVREAWGLDDLYTPRMEPLLARAEAGDDVSAIETLEEARRALDTAMKQADARTDAFIELFKRTLGSEYAKLCFRSRSGFTRKVDDILDVEDENEDITSLVPAE